MIDLEYFEWLEDKLCGTGGYDTFNLACKINHNEPSWCSEHCDYYKPDKECIRHAYMSDTEHEGY